MAVSARTEQTLAVGDVPEQQLPRGSFVKNGAAVALAAGGAAVAAYVVGLALGAPSAWVAVVALCCAYAAAVAACGIAAARSASGSRGGWLLLGGACAAYGGTSIYYAVVPDAALRFPGALDFGLFSFYPLVFAAFVAFIRRHIADSTRAVWLDCAIGALVAAALGAAAVAGAAATIGPAALGQLLFFVGDLGFLGFLFVAFAVSGWRRAPGLALLAAGATLLAIGDGVFAFGVAQGEPEPSLISLAAWPLGVLGLAAASLFGVSPAPSARSPWGRVGVPALSAVAVLPILLFSDGASVQGLLAGAALALVVARLIFSLLENARLLTASREAAVTDALTGLANRHLVTDRLQQALRRQGRGGGTVAVLFIDLDEFKAINDEHGHEVGDRVLVAVAGRLRDALRDEDTVARGVPQRPDDVVGRLGGDEFVVVLEGLSGPADSAQVAGRILTAVRTPLSFDGRDLALDASLGIAVTSGEAAADATVLLRDADIAMYAVKRAGKGDFRYFEPEMHDAVVAQTRLVRDLRVAVEREQMRLLYQPQIEVASGRMTGVEALVRWQHPERGLLTPDAFIDSAERTGLIVEIDNWVLHEACRQLRAWDDCGLQPLHMAINVSARRLTTGDLAADVADALRLAGVAAHRLEVELTETVAVEHDAAAVAQLTALRELGARVAIDDFGMGHSALSRLQSFPIDRLKIDRSFISSLTSGRERGSLADAMIALGQSLGLDVVAEGVETDEHLQALRLLGCRSAQGYLFSKPVAATAIDPLSRKATLAPDPGVHTPGNEPGGSTAPAQDRLVRNLLAELQRLTGLESTYLTHVDWNAGLQNITHARNTGALAIEEGVSIDWSDTVCRRALEQGITYTDDVAETFRDSVAAAELGLQTYISVPLLDRTGEPHGTLCGASSQRVKLGAEAVEVMKRFADMISSGVAGSTGVAATAARPEPVPGAAPATAPSGRTTAS